MEVIITKEAADVGEEGGVFNQLLAEYLPAHGYIKSLFLHKQPANFEVVVSSYHKRNSIPDSL